MRRRPPALLALLTVFALVVAACGGDDEATPTTTSASPAADATTTTVAEAAVLRIVLSNDDGIEAPGIDRMLQALAALPGVEVTVVAPAENQSGSSDKSTPGGAPYAPGTTASGTKGTAVDGFPADTVQVALDELGLEPHLFVAGINLGQNHGPFVALSGTVGVARTALRRGVPAIAVSAGDEYDEAEFAVAADLAVAWITEHRDALVGGTHPADFAVNLNVPTCPVESLGELVEVPVAEQFVEGVEAYEFACDLAPSNPANDHEALNAGYPTLSTVPADLPG